MAFGDILSPGSWIDDHISYSVINRQHLSLYVGL